MLNCNELAKCVTIEEYKFHHMNSDRLRSGRPYVLNFCHCVGFRMLSSTLNTRH